MKEKRKRGRPSAKTEIGVEKLLRHALKSFANLGYEAVSISKMAKELGVSHPIFYYHFKNKEDLWKKSMQFMVEHLVEKLINTNRDMKDLEGIPLLKVRMRQFIYFSAENPSFAKIILQEQTNMERTKWMFEQLLKPIHEQFAALISVEKEKGVFHDFSNAQIISAMLGVCVVFFVQNKQMQIIYNIDPFDEKQIETQADTAITLFFNGLIKNKE